jgi:hypothetical protein
MNVTGRQAMLIRILLILLGLFHAANGLFMVLAPSRWYLAVPGVVHTGPANLHFIPDIGFAFLLSGLGLLLGARQMRSAGAYALAGAAFPFVHALFHVWGWGMHGFPQGLAFIFSETIGVAGLSFLGMALAWLRAREGEA